MLVLGLSLVGGASYAEPTTNTPNTPAAAKTAPSPNAAKPSLGASINKSVVISSIVTGGAAEKAGLIAGDIIVKANGSWTSEVGLLVRAMYAGLADKPLSLLIFRAGHPLVVSVGPLPQDTDAATSDQKQPSSHVPTRHLGAAIYNGVIVNGIVPGSAAERAGLQTGDVITKLNGKEVADPEAFVHSVQALPANQQLYLMVIRAAQPVVVSIPELTVPNLGGSPNSQPGMPYKRISAEVPPAEELFKRLVSREYENLANGYSMSPRKVTLTFQRFKVDDPISNIVQATNGQSSRRNTSAADDAPLYPCRARFTVTEDYGEDQVYQYDLAGRFTAYVGVHPANTKGEWFIEGQGAPAK